MRRKTIQTLGSCGAGLLLLLGHVAAAEEAGIADHARNRDTAAVRALVEQRADVNAPQGDGTTALHWAAHWNDLEMANLLLGGGANVNAATDLGITPLILACTNGSHPMVEALLNGGGDPNLARASGEVPIMTCSRSGNPEAVKALLARGVDVNAQENVQGQTALMWAAAQNHADVVGLLLASGADVHARTTAAGFTPLLFAARHGAREAMDALLSAGADINELTWDGKSVLMIATYMGHWDLAQTLLDRGADPNLSEAKYTALHWMSGTWDGHFTGVVGTDKFAWVGGRGPGKLELVKALLEHGADPNARMDDRPELYGFGGGFYRADFTGATPFILAAYGGQAEIMRALLAAGADPLLTAYDGTTALMSAAGLGRTYGESRVNDEEAVETVKVALEAGLPVNAATRSGQTALHGVSFFRSIPVAEILLANGANVNARNLAGETPLTIAYGYDSGGGIFYSEELQDVLIKAGGVEVMEFSAAVRSLETACPAPPSLIVSVQSGMERASSDLNPYGGSRLRVIADEKTQFEGITCTDLKPGTTLLIQGTRLGHRLDANGRSWNGEVNATTVTLKN